MVGLFSTTTILVSTSPIRGQKGRHSQHPGAGHNHQKQIHFWMTELSRHDDDDDGLLHHHDLSAAVVVDPCRASWDGETAVGGFHLPLPPSHHTSQHSTGATKPS